MKIKKKGKVFPSPSSSSSSPASSISSGDALSVLKQLLPVTILTLASLLSLSDREVLAYMITRSNNTSPPPLVSRKQSKKSNYNKHTHKTPNSPALHHQYHKSPLFDCDCFDCYTNYWHRWNSSPNHQLIHQVIEAFEDYLSNNEDCFSHKRRPNIIEMPTQKETPPCVTEIVEIETVVEEEDVPVAAEVEERTAVVVRMEGISRKGFARKVLPDVMEYLNSRLWGVWNPKA